MPRPFTTDDIEICFGTPVFKRGAGYLRQGQVRRLEVVKDTPEWLELTGEVKATLERPFRLRVDWDGETFESECSCPVVYGCKHAVALLLAYHARRAKPPAPAAPSDWREVVTALERSKPGAKEPYVPLSIRLKTERAADGARHALYAAIYVGESRVPAPMIQPVIAGAQPGARLILNAIRPFLTRGASRDGWNLVVDHTVDEFLALMAASNRVADEGGRPLSIRPWEPVSVALEYRHEGEAATLVPAVSGVDEAPGGLRILGGTRAWAWTGDVLRPLEPGLAALGDRLAPVTIPTEERPEFERHLPDLALAGRITGKDLPVGQRIKPGKPIPQLVLEEVAGKLRGRLGFLYDGVRVEADEPMAHVGPPQGPWYARARAKERKLLDLLPQPAPISAWIEPKPSATFELAGDKALDFLLDELPRLADGGVEVLGEERLSSLRISRGTATSSFSVRSGVDWLDLEGSIEVEGERVPWPSLWDAIASRRRYVRLGSGRFARLPAEWLAAQRPLMEALGVDWNRLGAKGGVRVPRHQAPLLDALLAKADRAKTDKAWKTFIAKLKSFGGVEEVPLAPGFEGTLRPYQHQGLNFLSFLRDYGLHGILADDMGLGKTVQAAALLLANHQDRQGTPSLVIAPTSLLLNWQAELARFAPALRTLVLHGPDRDFTAIEAHDVVITTYATARLDLAEHQKRTYHTLILDEAQAIKNPKSQTAQAMRALGARHRLCLTGTPVENNLMELWSQFVFLMPGLLGKDQDFKARYVAPIAMGDREALATLKAHTAPFMLRRLKAEVAKELPPRTDTVVWCELAPAQRRLYETVLAASRARVMAAVEESGVARSQITILDALLKLRQVCCHPALLGVPETLHLPSAKADAFFELVDELIEGKHRALVFSQFTSMLAHLRERLDAKGIAYEYLDGRTKNRQAKVDRFNQGDAPLFLISLKAGGTGLNLVGADYVIHYDPWWNPAVEDQATDRAHRIGQTRQVFNYKLLAKDTVEEKLLQLQEQKRSLVRDVLDADALGKALTLDDLTFLFGEEPPAGARR